jgi:hypothetical protein
MTTIRTRETSVRIAHLFMNLDRLMDGLDAVITSKYVPEYIKEKLTLIKKSYEKDISIERIVRFRIYFMR